MKRDSTEQKKIFNHVFFIESVCLKKNDQRFSVQNEAAWKFY